MQLSHSTIFPVIVAQKNALSTRNSAISSCIQNASGWANMEQATDVSLNEAVGTEKRTRRAQSPGMKRAPAEKSAGAHELRAAVFRGTPGIGGDRSYMSSGNPKMPSQTDVMCPIIAFRAHSGSRARMQRRISIWLRTRLLVACWFHFV